MVLPMLEWVGRRCCGRTCCGGRGGRGRWWIGDRGRLLMVEGVEMFNHVEFECALLILDIVQQRIDVVLRR